jgi:hypothetical protein
MPEIKVVTEQLDALASRLLVVKQALQEASGLSGYDGALGSADLAASLGNFGQGWAAGRQDICDGIDNCHRDLSGASRAYVQHEQALANAQGTAAGSGAQ